MKIHPQIEIAITLGLYGVFIGSLFSELGIGFGWFLLFSTVTVAVMARVVRLENRS